MSESFAPYNNPVGQTGVLWWRVAYIPTYAHPLIDRPLRERLEGE